MQLLSFGTLAGAVMLASLACTTASAQTTNSPLMTMDPKVMTKEERAAQVTDEQRLKNVKEELKANPKSVAFFAKGMCCQSCAIGVRVHVASMNFVDKSRFNNGVKLNALTQVVTVAVKDEAKVHPHALKVAVQRAGYEPVEMYQLVSGKVERQSLQ